MYWLGTIRRICFEWQQQNTGTIQKKMPEVRFTVVNMQWFVNFCQYHVCACHIYDKSSSANVCLCERVKALMKFMRDLKNDMALYNIVIKAAIVLRLLVSHPWSRRL